MTNQPKLCWICWQPHKLLISDMGQSCSQAWVDWYRQYIEGSDHPDMYAEFLCICWVTAHFQGDIGDETRAI